MRPVDLIFLEWKQKRENNVCPVCNKKVNPDELRDELSKKEFQISGLCQECQDAVFDEGAE